MLKFMEFIGILWYSNGIFWKWTDPTQIERLTRPERLGENEKTRDAHSIRRLIKQQPGTVSEVRGRIGADGLGINGWFETGEIIGGDGIVEEIFAGEKIEGIETERSGVDLKRRAAESHYSEC